MVWSKHINIVLTVFLLINGQLCYASQNNHREISYQAYVTDSAEKVIIFSPAKIVDSSGIALVNPKLVKTWLDDVSYKLYVKDSRGNIYPVKNLISYSQRFNISILSLETQGQRLVETYSLISKNPLNDYIISVISKYKQKVHKQAKEEKDEEFDSQRLTPPPQTPPLKDSTIKKEPFEYIEIVKNFLRDKRFNEAEQSLQEVLNIEKDSADATMMLAHIYTATGRFKEAEGLYKKVYEQTHSKEIIKKLGFIYMILGQYKESIGQLRLYLNNNPFDTVAHFTIAVSFLLSGDKDSAFNQYIKLKRIDVPKAEELFDLLYR